MIEYYCDHCGEQIRKLDGLREIEYGFSSMGCNKKVSAAVVHAKCLDEIHKVLNEQIPVLKATGDV